MGCFEDNQLQYKGFQVHPFKTGFMKPNRYRMRDMGPLKVAENKWVTGVITCLYPYLYKMGPPNYYKWMYP